jgi:4-carboxymuconolactone decarboxylase
MIRFTTALTMFVLAASAAANGQDVVTTRAGSRAIRPGPADNFTGTAHIDMLFEAVAPSRASGGTVRFEAGARTAWHSHPGGQILIVTAGTGRVQAWGRPAQEIRPGDVVRIPPGQKHWHGASPDAAMMHLAITEHRDGSTVEWMEHVSDEQYRGAAPAPAARAGAAASAPQAAPSNQAAAAARPSGERQQRVAPGLAALTDDVLYGDVWRRTELSPRDRSLVTIAVLIATGKPAQLAGHLGRALDNGVHAREASGLLAHLAIYCGWPSAVTALEVYDQVYTARKVDTTALHAEGAHIATAASDATRAQPRGDESAVVAPKFVQLTNDIVFNDLWRRTDLTVRDRSLVTIAALAAMGDDDHLGPYLRRGVDAGLTRPQVAEALIHLAFYAGWPKAAKALETVESSLGR